MTALLPEDLPLLRGLDARGRREILSASRTVMLASGAALYRGGDPADELFAVLDGEVAREPGSHVSAPGDLVGEEAALGASATRVGSARARHGGTQLLAVPMNALRRAIERGGDGARGRWLKRLERTLRRAAARDLLASLGLDPSENDADLLDRARVRPVARGETLASPEGMLASPESDAAFVVGAGMLRTVYVGETSSVLVRQFERGAVVLAQASRAAGGLPLDVVCEAPGWVLVVPPPLAARLAEFAASDDKAAVTAIETRPFGPSERHARARDERGRIALARSLPVIDMSACVHCGRCAEACASTHADGLVRLVRRGPVIAREDAAAAAALLVESCHHCHTPACLTGCPVDAIERDREGTVRIDADRCTGCGACAKACPWGNITMAASPARGGARLAVKCDGCRDHGGGPACVRACPTEAFSRVDVAAMEATARASAAMRPARASPARAATNASASRTGAVALAATLAAYGCGTLAGPRIAGWVLALALLLLAAHSAAARVVAARHLRLAPLARAHVVLGAAAIGLFASHARWGVPTPLTRTLLIAGVAAVTSGLLVLATRAFLPARVARLLRASFAEGAASSPSAELERDRFRLLHGRGDGLKRLYALRLRAEGASVLGAVVAACRGLSLADIRASIEATLQKTLGSDALGRLEGLAPLVQSIADERAARARQLMIASLRALLVTHVVAAGATILLALWHVVARTLLR